MEFSETKGLAATFTSKGRYYIDLLTVLTQKEMKVRYKSSFFGYLWSIGHPLAFALVFFMVFKIVVKIQVENYALFLIAGLFPWQWFCNSVAAAPMSFLGNASIIKKMYFPRELIPFVQVLQEMIHFVFAIPVIVLFLFVHHKLPLLSWVYGIPALLFIQFLLTYGICLIVSSTNLFFRDLDRLTLIFTTLLFYLTPVIYPVTMIPHKYKHLMNLNPLAPLIISWRTLFLSGELEASHIAFGFVYAIFALILGYLVYRSLSWKFPEVL